MKRITTLPERRAVCSACGRNVQLTPSGSLRRHFGNVVGAWRQVVCSGSGVFVANRTAAARV